MSTLFTLIDQIKQALSGKAVASNHKHAAGVKPAVGLKKGVSVSQAPRAPGNQPQPKPPAHATAPTPQAHGVSATPEHAKAAVAPAQTSASANAAQVPAANTASANKSTSEQSEDAPTISVEETTNKVEPPAEAPEQNSSQGKDLRNDDEKNKQISSADNSVKFEGNLLTSEGAALKIPEESRNLCALFDSGLWLVSASHRYSPLVTSVAQMARRHGFEVGEPRYVTPNIIRQAYIMEQRQQVTTQLDDNAVRRRIVDVLEHAVESGASDIHIEASEGRTKVEFRVDGAMRVWQTWTQKEGELVLSSVFSHSIGQSGASANWQEPQAAMLASNSVGKDMIPLPKGVISVRCQWVPLADGGRYLDMRLQYDSAHIFGENFMMADVDSLGFSQEQLRVVKSLRQIPGGMRIFAGPVNQGKTTTLRLTLNRRMAETNMQMNCLLIEDPPEGGIIGARQIGVSASVKDDQREKTFVEIMRCALRLDPDIVMLGEIRDIQTAQFSFRLALTGRQVYTTTHVYSAIAIPQRLRDIGMEQYLVYDHNLVRGMFCQRLTRTLCTHCRVPLYSAVKEFGPSYQEIVRRTRAGIAMMDAARTPHEEDEPLLNRLVEPDLSNAYVPNPDGCPHCYKGRAGRTVCAEVIESDYKIMRLLEKNEMLEASNYWLSPNGMGGITMLWHSMDKLRHGDVSPHDVEIDIGLLARDRDIMEVEQRLGVLP